MWSRFGVSTSNMRGLIATTTLFILCIPLTGLSALLITAKNISDHIQHAAIALLCCAVLSPSLIITYALRSGLGPPTSLRKTVPGILAFIWLVCLAILAPTTKYATEGSVRAIVVSVVVIAAVQL